MNKPKSPIRAIQLVSILLFFNILLFPLLLMLLNGPDATVSESEEPTEMLPLSYDSYVSGEFHQAFEAWFSHKYPMRNAIVELYSTMTYRIEMSPPAVALMRALRALGTPTVPPTQEPPPIATPPSTDPPGTPSPPPEVIDPMAIYTDPDNVYAEINRRQLQEIPIEPQGFRGTNGITVGKSGYLYQDHYIDGMFGLSSVYTEMSAQGIAQTVEQLDYIQKALWDRYGITMVLVISPNKASMYQDFVPDHYLDRFPRPDDYIRPVDILRRHLASSNVLYIDSERYYREIGLLNTFPKTGIHWNHLASFETCAQILHLYQNYSGEECRTLEMTEILERDEPSHYGTRSSNDADIYHILYDAIGTEEGTIMDDAYYYPIVDVDNEDAEPLNILLQGGSFATDLHYYLNTYEIGQVRYIHYNGLRHRNTWEGDDPWSNGIMIWEEILSELDLVIFELNEDYVRGGHCSENNWLSDCQNDSIGSNATYDSLYRFLKATE